MSTFVVSTTTRELVFGSLNSGFSSSPAATSSGSATCGCFPKLEFGRGVSCTGSSTIATSTFDILDLSVLTRPHNQRLLVQSGMTKPGPRGSEVLKSQHRPCISDCDPDCAMWEWTLDDLGIRKFWRFGCRLHGGSQTASSRVASAGCSSDNRQLIWVRRCICFYSDVDEP